MTIEHQVQTALTRGPGAQLTELSARYLEEYLAKIRVGVERLDESHVWWHPTKDSNSVGNLLLHLHGNLSLWLLKSLGGYDFERDRTAEFTAERTHTRSQLIEQLAETVAGCREVLTAIDQSTLNQVVEVQGYSTDIRGIIFHATEHMSYHTGQILWIVKQLTTDRQPLELYPQHQGE